jgi:hypothetical protein
MRSIDYNNNFKVGDMAAEAVLLKFQSRGLDKIDAAYPAVGSLSVYIGEMLNIAQSFDPEVYSQLKQYVNARTDAALKEKIEQITARSGE